jgi:hypothetical protein
MVDLQRSIDHKLNIDCVWKQDDGANSDTAALPNTNRSQIFSALDSSENFIRLDFR